MATDSAGNLFIADGGSVHKVSINGIITTVANGATARTADGGSLLYQAYSVAADGGRNVFIAATNGVLKVSSDATIGIVAGTCWYFCFAGDAGPASQAQLSESASVALEGNGSLYIADAGGTIRKVAPDGGISTAVPGACVMLCRTANSLYGAGNIYYSDDDATFKVSPAGSILALRNGRG